MEVTNFNKVIDQFIADARSKNFSSPNAASVRKLSSTLFWQLKTFEDSSPTGRTSEWVNLKEKITILENELHSLLKDEESNPQIQQTFKEIERVKSIAEKQLQSSPHSKVETVIAQSVGHRGYLTSIRRDAKEQLLKGNSAEKVSRHLSQNMARFVSSLYQEAIDKLGPPPCDYCLVVFGSMARQESGPFPDVDDMLIVEKRTPESLRYFTKVNQYVADSIHRLGEGEAFDKPGLRFCPGDLNPSYQRYDFRYADNPRGDFLRSLEQDHNERLQQIADKKGELTKLSEEINRLEKDYAASGDPGLESKINALKFDHRMLSEEVEFMEAEAERSRHMQVTRGRQALNEVTLELEQAIQAHAANPSKALQDKVDALSKEKEGLEHEQERMERDARGGTVELYVEPDAGDATLAPLSSFPEHERQRMEFLLGQVFNDNLPVYGNKDLYTQYMSLRPSVSSGAASEVKKGAEKSIRSMIAEIKNNKVHPHPARDNGITGMMHVKEELYRFPQAMVANLARLHGVTETNTFDRIRALTDKGVFDKSFGDKLLQAMDQLVKFRILAQSNYGEEFELVTPFDWKSFNTFYTSISKEIDELSAKYPNRKEQIKDLEIEIKELKIKADAGDAKASVDLEQKKEERDNLVNIDRTIDFRRQQRKLWSKIAQKEFGEKRPDMTIDKVKTPTIPDGEWQVFKDQTLKVLHHLYNMGVESQRDENHFDASAFAKPFVA